MSVMVGSPGSKFIQQGPESEDVPFKRKELEGGQLKRSLPPKRYQGLRVGPEMVLEWEDNQTLPVDSSDSMLRNLSPFTVQVELPPVLANIPQGSAASKATGLFDSAFNSTSDNNSASSTLQSEGANFVKSQDVGGGTVDSVMTSSGVQSPEGSEAGPERQGKVGEPSIGDLKSALDIATQIAAVHQTPPLVLLINPKNLSMNYTRIHQFSDRSRFGYIYQAWGQEQPRLSINARCGAFITGGRGVHYASKRDSASWQNLMTLFQFYKSNGYIYDTLNKSNANLFVGGLSIHYDGWIYYGHLENFSWTYDDRTQLGGIEFNMEFVCSVMVDTSKQTTAVLPLRSPQLGAMDRRFNESVKGANTKSLNNGISVTLDGTTEGSFFGDRSDALADRRRNEGTQVFAPSPSASSSGPPVRGSKVVAKGGGFVSPQTPTSTSPKQSSRPQPFRRGG